MPESLTVAQWAWVGPLLLLVASIGAVAGAMARDWWMSRP